MKRTSLIRYFTYKIEFILIFFSLRSRMILHCSDRQRISSGAKKHFLGIKQYTYFTVCPPLSKKNVQMTLVDKSKTETAVYAVKSIQTMDVIK